MTEIVLTFRTTQQAIAAEAALDTAQIAARVMPLPSSIRAGCGLCLRIAPADWQRAMAVLAQAAAIPQDVYTRTVHGGKSAYQPYQEDCHG